MDKKKYEILLRFKWREDWVSPGDEALELLDCEAGMLLRSGKIKPLEVTQPTKKKEGK